MRNSMRKAVLGTIKDLYQSGLIDKETLTRMENLGVPDLKEYSPEPNHPLDKLAGSAQGTGEPVGREHNRYLYGDANR